MTRHFETVQSLTNYLFGGDGKSGSAPDRALLTMAVGETHRTIRVVRAKDKNGGDPPRKWFASVLAPEGRWVYMGLFVDKGGRVPHLVQTRKSGVSPQALSWRWLYRLMERIALSQYPGDKIPETLNLAHDGHCSKCGRTLTNPLSLTTGIGPVCAGRLE